LASQDLLLHERFEGKIQRIGCALLFNDHHFHRDDQHHILSKRSSSCYSAFVVFDFRSS
jgi:hypothetical protein